MADKDKNPFYAFCDMMKKEDPNFTNLKWSEKQAAYVKYDKEQKNA